MYESYFKLSKSPFDLSPDPAFLFLTPSHREVLAGLMYGVLNRKGFIVLIGDPGTGKTTLLHRALQALGANSSFVASPTVTNNEFTKLAIHGFGIDVSQDKAEQVLRFENFLRRSREKRKPCVLVVDEAQELSSSVLEEIRILTNLENPGEKLLQVILSGQRGLRNSLNRPELRQLKQRIAVRLTLDPLADTEEVESYIRRRWALAGGIAPRPFEPEAVELIARYSSMIPRVVNVLCDNLLLAAFSAGSKLVTADQVRETALELDLIELPESIHSNRSSPSVDRGPGERQAPSATSATGLEFVG